MTFEEWFVANRMELAIRNRAKCKAVWEAAQKTCREDCAKLVKSAVIDERQACATICREVGAWGCEGRILARGKS